MRQPDFDIDQKIGTQSEIWVNDICKMLAEGSGSVEVKAPKPFLESGSAYIEFECRGRDGIWYKSGVATSKARIFVLCFGELPGGMFVEVEWLRRASRLAWKAGRRKECTRGSNPTRGVVVSMRDLWETRECDP